MNNFAGRTPHIKVEGLDHLGIVRAIDKRAKLSERMENILPKKMRHHKITHAQAIMAMITNGLGFSPNRLYKTKKAFEQVAVEKVLGEGIKAEYLNDDVLGRALDAIYEYGPSDFFMDVAFKAAIDLGVVSNELHLDSTSLSFQGRFKKQKGKVKITYGHSKAKRPDLIQIVLSMVTGGKSGIPFWIDTHSGNINDKSLFQQIIDRVDSFKKAFAPKKSVLYIADSSLYTKDYLLNKSFYTKWITRVPESVKSAKRILESDHKEESWQKIGGGVKVKSTIAYYGGVRQRWVIVHSHKAYFKEKRTFDARLEEKELALHKTIRQLDGKFFDNEFEPTDKVRNLKTNYPFFRIKSEILPVYNGLDDDGAMILQGFKLKINFEKNRYKIHKAHNRKGKFILSTNLLNKSKHSDKAIFESYRRRNGNIEACFRYLKNSTYLTKGLYFKKVERIQALLVVMALSLFIHNLGQLWLRQGLTSQKQTLPNQLGSPTKTPTLSWAFELLSNINVVKIRYRKWIHSQITGLTEEIKIIIRIFGPHAREIYGIP